MYVKIDYTAGENVINSSTNKGPSDVRTYIMQIAKITAFLRMTGAVGGQGRVEGDDRRSRNNGRGATWDPLTPLYFPLLWKVSSPSLAYSTSHPPLLQRV